MTLVFATLGILIMVVGIAASIALHEIGHLLPAKLFNVRVTQYMIGFGPTIWSKTKGETEYGVKAFPLGGYVAMIGMYPPPEETDDDAADPAEQSDPAGQSDPGEQSETADGGQDSGPTDPYLQ